MTYKNFKIHFSVKSGNYHAFNFITFQSAGPSPTLPEIKKEIDEKTEKK